MCAQCLFEGYSTYNMVSNTCNFDLSQPNALKPEINQGYYFISFFLFFTMHVPVCVQSGLGSLICVSS